MIKTVYDLTPDQLQMVGMLALNQAVAKTDLKDVEVDTAEVLESGILFKATTKHWIGDIWLSKDRGGVVLRTDPEVDHPILEDNKEAVINYLVQEGAW